MPRFVAPLARTTLVLALALLAACSRCGGARSTQPAEQFAPADATILIQVPNIGQLADRVQAALGTARAGAGGDRLIQLTAGVATQLGFDPFTRDGLKQAGIDPDRSTAFGAGKSTGTSAFAYIPYEDRATLEATLDRLARDRAGAGVKETRTQDDAKLTVLTNAAGGPALMAYAERDGFLLVGGGDQAMVAVAAALKRKPEESLSKNAVYTATKAKLGQREAYVFLPKAELQGAPSLPGAAGLGVSITANELALRLYVDLNEEQRKLATGALVGGGDAVLGKLPKNAPVYVRGALNWQGMVATAEERPQMKEAFDKARALAKEQNIDLDEELLKNIAPEFAIAIGIAPTANLSTAFEFDPRRQNPFENYTLLGVGHVKDAERAKATLEKLGPIIEKFGTSVSMKELAGAKTWSADYRLGTGLSWTLRGKDLVVAGGYGDALEKTLQGLDDKAQVVAQGEFAPRMRETLFKKEGLALAIDFNRIGQTVDQLPTEAFGTGPGALMARSVASNFIQPLARLKAVVALAPLENGLVVDLSVAAQ